MNIMNKYTLRTLKMNKVRTLITIIGIVLSVSMLTAVTSLISSMQRFSVNHAISEDGSWHGAVFQLTKGELDTLLSDEKIVKAGVGQHIGYAYGDTINEDKPYIYVYGLGEGFTGLLPVKMTEGSMPASKNEIILPNHLKYNGGVMHHVGDEITLEIGDRYIGEEILYQQNPFVPGEDGTLPETDAAEKLRIRETRTYKVTGFYERPSFEDYSASGYTALTVGDSDSGTVYDAYIRVKKPKDIYAYIKDHYKEKGAAFNSSYLRYLNASNNSNFNRTLYSLGAILIIIIMSGSISLIYNAFSISVSERIKQFGLLSSIGGTRRQIIKSVLFEAAVLSGIGIPLGIAAGIGGIGITLMFTESLFLNILNTDVALTLYVSWPSVVIAGAVGFVTVLISAHIPARRAGKVSAIDAIRQSKDILIKGRKVKTSPLVYKIFGLEGMIASKNFKRNRKKYKATVISLFMSVVLFISASSFCTYLTKGTRTAVNDLEYDIYYSFNPDDAGEIGYEDGARILGSVEGVTKLGYNWNVYTMIKVKAEEINKRYLDYIGAGQDSNLDADELITLAGNLFFVDDSTFWEYWKERGYSEEDKDEFPSAIIVDTVNFYVQEEGRYHTYRAFDKKEVEFHLQPENQDTQETGGETVLTARTEEKGPFGVNNYNYGSLVVVFPLSQVEDVLELLGIENARYAYSMYMKTTDHKEVYQRLYKAAEEGGLSPYRLYDMMESTEGKRAMITVIRIFSYGFIVLISLIAAANVFNTITTNIALRRVEFAMLKSTGMTRKGFRKMMNYECLLYGLRSLLFGIPVSIGITYLIYRSMGYGVEMEFFLPWDSIIVAVGSVFLVVFSTMLYSMHKISKENTIDTLKNENI
ncbi:putative ABC transport system permease protein [Anaerotaenia torta]|uniref:ABC transporter permease n=1 Tax=Anaerotaenia torta TaxID=433293 RepID=UPI003D1B695F